MYKTSEMLILGFLLNMFKIWGTLNIKDWVFTYLYMLLRLELGRTCKLWQRCLPITWRGKNCLIGCRGWFHGTAIHVNRIKQ